MAQATATEGGEFRAWAGVARYRGPRVHHPADAWRGFGDGRHLDLQPLPLRARLARETGSNLGALRRPRSKLPGRQLQRRGALPTRLARGDARAGRAARTGRFRISRTRASRRRAMGGPGDAARFRARRRRGCYEGAPDADHVDPCQGWIGSRRARRPADGRQPASRATDPSAVRSSGSKRPPR